MALIMRADLHCHTKISDGSLGIAELLMVAARLKMKFLSITDCDTMGGVSRAVVVGKRLGIEVIPGVELTALDPETGKDVHLLCYLPDYPDRLEGYFKRMSDTRKQIFEKRIKLICEKLPINPQMVMLHTQGCTTVYEAHIMHTLMDCGYTDKIYGDLYNAFFGKGKSCDIPLDCGDYTEVMQLIKSAGGLAVLAHPGKSDNLDLVDKLADLGLDGIEWEHFRNNAACKENIKQLCEQYDLVMTGGSDFHGMYETPIRPIGNNTVTEIEVKALYNRKQKQQKAAINL
ncbi:MAG TPA: PHP domain-containing protein [Oscillospiraceae bacterium]|nr:PHP domain-containing protein [Oscillospiraceae bacterium]HPF57033.1 PHP domain-containing protein [Clostridiales bacterium]HPK36429.1 PHP domain-containing protein [Oscillospiraceae bacterium]HPR76386.1 PHP domain-containing protein [Oscillospiraceae bacterium]